MRIIVRAGWRFSVNLTKRMFFALANLLLLNYGIEGETKRCFVRLIYVCFLYFKVLKYKISVIKHKWMYLCFLLQQRQPES